MNAILLSPHFPDNWYNFAIALRRTGANVLGIADAPYEGLSPELRGALTEYYRVDDMEQYDQLYRAVAYFAFKHGRIDRLESHNEYWLTTEARLRTDFNINGIREHEIADMKFKSRMKAKFIAAGVPVARGRVVRSLGEAEALIEETGYPVVAKPDSGVGAERTYRIDDPEALARFFDAKPPVDYIMEEFIRGQIVSFDGLAGSDGRPVFAAAHLFSQGIMEIVNDDRDLFYYSLREIPSDLADAGNRVVAAFGVRERFFHLEFFRTPEGRLVALEVNMRPPGGWTMDMFNYANDADLYQEWANVVAGRPVRTGYDRPYFCAFAGRKSHKAYCYPHEMIVEHLGPVLAKHGPLSPVFGRAMGNYAYVLRSPDESEIHAAINLIHETAAN